MGAEKHLTKTKQKKRTLTHSLRSRTLPTHSFRTARQPQSPGPSRQQSGSRGPGVRGCSRACVHAPPTVGGARGLPGPPASCNLERVLPFPHSMDFFTLLPPFKAKKRRSYSWFSLLLQPKDTGVFLKKLQNCLAGMQDGRLETFQ